MISREELDRIQEMVKDYANPPRPRSGHETIALQDRIYEAVMQNLGGLLEAAERGVRAYNFELTDYQISAISKAINARFDAFAQEMSKRIKEIADKVEDTSG